MTKEKLSKIREAISILFSISNEDWEEFLEMIEELNGDKQNSKVKLKSEERVNKKVSNILIKLGIQPNMKGFEYLRDAIKFYLFAEKTEEIMITKQLYSKIADDHKTQITRVERNIRNAIEVAWDRVYDKDFHNQLFGDVTKFKKGVPTNKEFIASIAEYLKNN